MLEQERPDDSREAAVDGNETIGAPAVGVQLLKSGAFDESFSGLQRSARPPNRPEKREPRGRCLVGIISSSVRTVQEAGIILEMVGSSANFSLFPSAFLAPS